eukprot:7204102-Pyramimonas_sp.AAC.1
MPQEAPHRPPIGLQEAPRQPKMVRKQPPKPPKRTPKRARRSKHGPIPFRKTYMFTIFAQRPPRSRQDGKRESQKAPTSHQTAKESSKRDPRRLKWGSGVP